MLQAKSHRKKPNYYETKEHAMLTVNMWHSLSIANIVHVPDSKETLFILELQSFYHVPVITKVQTSDHVSEATLLLAC